MSQIRYLLEAAGLFTLYGFFKVLPVQKASAVGGWLGRTIGPRLAASRKALRHLSGALPDLTEKQKNQIIRDMWDNLGRVFAEYPHLEEIAEKHVTVVNGRIVRDVLQDNKGAVFIGAHLGNWEILGAALLKKYGQVLNLTYRAPNNPYVSKLLNDARTLKGKLKSFPKARSSAKKILDALKNREYIGVLIDQKYNEGIAIPFFGRPAMTNPVAFQFAHRYDVPLVAIRCERVDGCNFIVKAYKPLSFQDENGEDKPLENVMREAHLLMERWIMENPAQWLWLHKRWDSKSLSHGERENEERIKNDQAL